MDNTPSYPIDRRNRVVRRHERGRYDKATVHAVLDAALSAISPTSSTASPSPVNQR